jgi:hypothetical protein
VQQVRKRNMCQVLRYAWVRESGDAICTSCWCSSDDDVLLVPTFHYSDYEGNMPARYLRHGSQPEDFPTVRDMPQLEPFWAAGFSFSRGHFKLRVPYDAYQPMVFQVRCAVWHYPCMALPASSIPALQPMMAAARITSCV